MIVLAESHDDVLDGRHTFAFKIADANFIQLDNVNAYLVICYVAAAPTPVAPPCQSPDKSRRFKAGWRDHALARDQSFSIALDDFMRLPAAASPVTMPEISPPPPTGTTTVSTSGSCSTISSATVAWPATMSG